MTEQWTLSFAQPAAWINANDRSHWTRKATLTKVWRDATYVYARAQKLPKGLMRVRIVATLHFGDSRRRDAHNYYPTLKAVVDGLVDYGLIPDDNTNHLDGPDIRRGNGPAGKAALGTITLMIEQLKAGAV